MTVEHILSQYGLSASMVALIVAITVKWKQVKYNTNSIKKINTKLVKMDEKLDNINENVAETRGIVTVLRDRLK